MIGRKRRLTASSVDSTVFAPVYPHFGKLYDQDGVFCRKTDQRDQTDLRINVIGKARHQD